MQSIIDRNVLQSLSPIMLPNLSSKTIIEVTDENGTMAHPFFGRFVAV